MHVSRFCVVLANTSRKYEATSVFTSHSRGLAHPELFAITSKKQNHLMLHTYTTSAFHPVGVCLASWANAGW